ncbi:MAG: TonB family protein [Janthinobacterium lividum]
MSATFFLTWLAGTLLPLGALWLVWRLALRGERCFGYNRALLLLAPVLATVLPLLPRPALPLWLSSPAVSAVAAKTGASVLLPVMQVGPATGPAIDWSIWTWLGLVYLAGVALGLTRLAWQAGRLWRLARHLPREVRPGYVLAYTGGRLPASSFGQVIFWDETAPLTPAEASAVLAHELAHVQQHHTRDVLWLEAWRAVLWPNPFSHLLLPALRLTHELLADSAAATVEAPEAHAAPYPTLLARLAARQLGGRAYSTLLQPFHFSFTLTRIAMLQNQIPVRRWKQWLALPALAGLFFVAGQSASAQSAPTKAKPAVPAPPVATEKPAPPLVIGGRKVYTYVEQMPALPGGGSVNAIVEAIQNKLVYPKLEKSAQKDGMVFAKFIVEADGSVKEPGIVKGLSAPYDEAVLAAVRQLPRFVPGKQNGQPIAVSFTVPVKFQLAANK